MRKVNYDSFMKEKEKYFDLRCILDKKRRSRRKKRNDDERLALMIFDYNRFLNWLNNKTLEIISPRHFKINLKKEDYI
jgi:hypothetical protein